VFLRPKKDVFLSLSWVIAEQVTGEPYRPLALNFMFIAE
jgi:hypothetical protein